MILSEYLERLNDLILKNPEAADYDVIYSIDEDGNEYSYVHHSPVAGFFDDDNGKFDSEVDNPNTVCIN